MVDGVYSIKNVVQEIEYDISYLEDAPDEKLEPYVEKLGTVGERLMRLREYLASRAGNDPVSG